MKEDTPSTGYSHWHPRVTNVVYFPTNEDGTAIFPLKKRYEETNLTLDGLENPCDTRLEDLGGPNEDDPNFDEEVWEAKEGEAEARPHVESNPTTTESKSDLYYLDGPATLRPTKSGQLRRADMTQSFIVSKSVKPNWISSHEWEKARKGRAEGTTLAHRLRRA